MRSAALQLRAVVATSGPHCLSTKEMVDKRPRMIAECGTCPFSFPGNAKLVLRDSLISILPPQHLARRRVDYTCKSVPNQRPLQRKRGESVYLRSPASSSRRRTSTTLAAWNPVGTRFGIAAAAAKALSSSGVIKRCLRAISRRRVQ